MLPPPGAGENQPGKKQIHFQKKTEKPSSAPISQPLGIS